MDLARAANPDALALWRVACTDAGFDPEELVLVMRDGEPIRGHSGIHLGPGDAPDPATAAVMGSTLATGLAQEVHTHRVGVVRSGSQHVLLGLFRHELEHARQFDLDSRHVTYRTHRLLVESIGPIAAGPGSAALYKSIPHEHDADVAATALVSRELGPPPPIVLESTDHLLVSTQRTRVDDEPLPARGLAMAALFAREFEEACGTRGVAAGDVADELGYPGVWAKIRDLPDAKATHHELLGLIPDRTSLEAGSVQDQQAAWRTVRESLQKGLERALAAIRSS